MKTNQNFGQVVAALEQGKIVSRESWADRGMFAFRQVPSLVPADVIPRMTSLPQAVKDFFVATGKAITYQNQFCIVHADNSIHGWQPTAADALATDWRIHDEHVVAGDTVGAATPL